MDGALVQQNRPGQHVGGASHARVGPSLRKENVVSRINDPLFNVVARRQIFAAPTLQLRPGNALHIEVRQDRHRRRPVLAHHVAGHRLRVDIELLRNSPAQPRRIEHGSGT